MKVGINFNAYRAADIYIFPVTCYITLLRGLSPRANYTDRAAAAGRLGQFYLGYITDMCIHFITIC
jgi:hypothetical protein